MKKCYGCVEEEKVSQNGNSRYETSSVSILLISIVNFLYSYFLLLAH